MNKILKLAKSAVWFVLCLLVGALIFEGIRSFANINKPAKRVGISVITEEEHDYLVVDTKHGVCVIHAESCPCHKKKQRMIEKILKIVAQRLNALATKVFKEDTYPYPPLSRRERRKFERDNKKAEKNIAICRRCMKDAPSWWCPGERCYFFPYRKHVLFGD